ncbi:MAG: flavin reductase family protein [Actinomycetota bacterium]
MSDSPPNTPVDEATFRRAMGRFATGVTVIGARVDGLDHAMTASAFTSVSLDPLLVLVCVERDARFHEAITAAPGWTVSVLAESQQRIADWLATPGRSLQGQLAQVPHHHGSRTGAPLVAGALATLECRTVHRYPGGDHTIVVGRVISLEVPDNPASPLLYHRGSYAYF